MTQIHHLVRLGKNLQRAWQTHAEQPRRNDVHFLGRVQSFQRQLRDAWRLLEKARSHGLILIVPQLHSQLSQRLQGVRDELSQLDRQVGEPSSNTPSLAFLVAELRALHYHFNEPEIDWKEKVLTVTTESIELEDVLLGRFAIQLHWERLLYYQDIRCFDVVALDPNPSSTNDLVTHPHVRDGDLCPGEACVPLQKAMEQGRLCDAFLLIRSVLRQYNSSSSHVRLEQWLGTECHDCGCSAREEDSYYCEGCNDDYCSGCISECVACGLIRCHGCLSSCAVCEDRFCDRCLHTSAHSGRECCGNCHTMCERCAAEVATDELSEESRLCPACQKQADRSNTVTDASSADPQTPNPENQRVPSLESVPCA